MLNGITGDKNKFRRLITSTDDLRNYLRAGHTGSGTTLMIRYRAIGITALVFSRHAVGLKGATADIVTISGRGHRLPRK
jgi:hypothetical protein